VWYVGMVYDETQNYDNSFHVGGSMLLTGGLLLCLLHLPSLRNYSAASHTDTESISTELPLPADDTKHQHGPKFFPDMDKRGNEMTLTVRD